MIKICKRCGEKFTVYTENKIKNQVYCSFKCRVPHKTKKEVNCKFCNKSFYKRILDINKTNNNFCSRSCAAKYNNKIYKKRIKNKKFCKICGKNVTNLNNRILCDKCYNKRKIFKNTTLKKYFNTRKNMQASNKYSGIRNFNKKWNQHLVGKPCTECGYAIHTELCHIKPIHTFPEIATLGEINSANNIIILCKNCHWEFDHNILII